MKGEAASYQIAEIAIAQAIFAQNDEIHAKDGAVGKRGDAIPRQLPITRSTRENDDQLSPIS